MKIIGEISPNTLKQLKETENVRLSSQKTGKWPTSIFLTGNFPLIYTQPGHIQQ
ncbi:hypothetical protein B14911_02499 [Bacillus sp. NRRL B-14911]|nr:hypothetical protein B14911_02499 [Bacillus sp. NRRL B-14911]